MEGALGRAGTVVTYSKCFECGQLTNLVCADCARHVPGNHVYVCTDCRGEHLKKCSCTYRVGGPIVVRAADLPSVDCGPLPPSVISYPSVDQFLQPYLDAYRVTPADVRRLRHQRWVALSPTVFLLLLSLGGCLLYATGPLSVGNVTGLVVCGLCSLLWLAVLAFEWRK